MSLLILDSTLREGEQAASISFTAEQKLSIARMLSDFGVNFIEISPIVSEEQKQITKQLNQMGLRPAIVSHARALKEDIDIALDCDSEWVALFISSSQVQLQSKLRINEESALQKAQDTITYAKEHGLKVRFTCEDSTRTTLDSLKRFCRTVSDAKVDRIGITDTVGAMNPERMAGIVREIRDTVPTPLDVHCHNDLGLALANSLAAYMAGATCVHTSIDGIGERAGITRLAELVVAMEVCHNEKLDVRKDMLTVLSQTVADYASTQVYSFMPLVGRNAFRHKGGTHLSAVLRNSETYELIPPESVGNRRTLVLGEYSGRGMMRYLSESLGMNLSEEQMEREIQKIKRRHGDVLEFGD